ncbi:MAG: hypothetical protein QOC81_1751 [Thermoanaerobaculia bacterium]|jgi:hypothetical protein|nr:hypothetical protein [Thermoanaerobaculia bacterium]
MDEASTPSNCLNCGAALTGRWCAQCGQRVASVRPSLHELLHEAVHEIAHIDGKLIRTAGLLLFRPGALTTEFLEGKRVRSVTPVRVYLLCSVLFFGILSLLPTGPLTVRITKGRDAQLTQAAERVNKDPALLVHALESAFPKAMFVLMPLFALIVFAFYFRAERMYVPHFYFAVHYHAFGFVLLALYEATSPIHVRAVGIIRLLALLTLFPYLGISLQRVYGGRKWLTALKTIAILSIYGFFIICTMAAIAFVTLRRL